MRAAVLVLLWSLALPGLAAQLAGLPRQGDIGARLAPPEGGTPARVRSVVEGGVAARAGLRADDRVLRIDGRAAETDADTLQARLRRLRAGDTLRLDLERGGRPFSVQLRAEPRPLERIDGLRVEYGAVAMPAGGRVRTLLTRPPAARGRLPVAVFIPWLSCSTVEIPADGGDGWARMLAQVARDSGVALLRVERPGVGDSEGPDCSAATLDDDMAAFRAVLQSVRRDPRFDPDAIYLFGGSIGASLAPILAGEFPVAGIVASGGFARTWGEHILGFERRRLTLSGRAPSEVNTAMRGFLPFYARYLDERRDPVDIVTADPRLREVWYDAPRHQFGRPAQYYRQLQALDVESAWARVDVPVLLLWGEYDWIMGSDDQERIAALLRPRLGGRFTYVVQPGMNHHFEVFADAGRAFDEEGGRYAAEAAAVIAGWLRRQAAARATGEQ